MQTHWLLPYNQLRELISAFKAWYTVSNRKLPCAQACDIAWVCKPHPNDIGTYSESHTGQHDVHPVYKSGPNYVKAGVLFSRITSYPPEIRRWHLHMSSTLPISANKACPPKPRSHSAYNTTFVINVIHRYVNTNQVE